MVHNTWPLHALIAYSTEELWSLADWPQIQIRANGLLHAQPIISDKHLADGTPDEVYY